MKFWHFILGVFLVFAVLIALVRKYSETPAQFNARMENVYQGHPELRPAPVVNIPPPPKTEAENCQIIHAHLDNKRIADLTMKELEALQACRLLGH
jgi:hypothetical protein